MKMIRQHGQIKKYDYRLLGISGRLDTLQAIVLLEKIKLLDVEISKRKKSSIITIRIYQKLMEFK